MAAHLQEKGWNILPIFSCKAESCNSVQDVQKYIAYHLWNLLPSTEKELFQEISFADSNTSAIDKVSSQRDSLTLWQDRITELSLAYERSVDANLLIFIDDADLLQRGSGEDLLRLLPANLGRKIRMVVTLLDAKTIPYGEKRGADTEHDPRNIIDYTLQSLHRELGEDVINAILAKPQSAHAMYTNLLVHRLCMFDSKDYAQINANGGGIEAISNYQKSIIDQCGNDFDLSAELLQKAAQQLDNPSLYVAMEYLAASKNGLKEENLASLLEQQGMHWVSLDFRRFLLYLSPFFITKNDGRIFFSSRFLLQGVVSSSLDHLGYHPILLEYLKAHPSDEKAYISEIAYQLNLRLRKLCILPKVI